MGGVIWIGGFVFVAWLLMRAMRAGFQKTLREAFHPPEKKPWTCAGETKLDDSRIVPSGPDLRCGQSKIDEDYEKSKTQSHSGGVSP